MVYGECRITHNWSSAVTFHESFGLVAVGVGSAVYWYVSETMGHGDLRPYGLVQFYPAVALPLICLLFSGRRTDGRSLAWLMLWYAVAKLCEHFDGAIYDLLGNTVSGHTIKHLVAAAAILVVIRMVRRPPNPPAP